MSEINIDMVLDKLNKYYLDICNIENNRYLSWEHCYNAFCYARKNETVDIDYLCLHLAFYLASWGMYRGSSFLLQKDYKFHKPIVEEILDSKYDSLVGIPAKELVKEENINLLIEISNKIAGLYECASPGHENRKNHATDTLITKILLGTLGCVPAYDRYFVKSLKKYNIASGTYNKNSMVDICKFYIKYSSDFQKINIPYPQMKLVDMCMWQLGIDE